MIDPITRRTFLCSAGVSAATLPFISGLPSVSGALLDPKPRRLIIVFSANGVIGDAMWPDAPGPIEKFKPILEPLEPYRSRVSTLRGVNNKVRGLGDNHMRGISCLLTGNELFPGNIVGGGGTTPAGWAKSISLDQQIKNHLQKNEQTRTVFGSLEFGVAVPNRSDPGHGCATRAPTNRSRRSVTRGRWSTSSTARRPTSSPYSASSIA